MFRDGHGTRLIQKYEMLILYMHSCLSATVLLHSITEDRNALEVKTFEDNI